MMAATATKPKTTDATQIVLARIPRNKRGEEVWVTSGEFKGVDLLGVRVYYLDEATGEHKPSKKGVALRPETWGQVLPYLEAAVMAAGVEWGDE
jgi:hypothetical protein